MSKARKTNDETGSFSLYVERINSVLLPKQGSVEVLDLFAGCGGLSLGFEAQGFEVTGYEMLDRYCETYTRNLLGRCHHQRITSETVFPTARVVIGGPPCQPFSVVGNQKGKDDERNGMPTFVAALRRVEPDIWMFENVRGLLYRSRSYLDEVLAELRSLGYIVEAKLLNAVDFGVPQNRERLIVVGHRSVFHWPERELHRVTAEEAVGDSATTSPPESKFLSASMDEYIARYETKSSCITPRDLHMDRPARTLTCRNLAGATSDMQRVRLPDGRRRRLLVKEAKRLQSFPDWFGLAGSTDDQFNQIGNSVAPLFAYHLAGSFRRYLDSGVRLSREEIEDKNSFIGQGVLL